MTETETFIDKMKRRKALTTAAADDFLLEPAGDIVKPDDDPHYDDRARLYCARALQGICEQIAHTPEGNRNQTLNDGALRALRWVLGGNLNQERAVHQLREAGQVCGLPGDEIARTLNSAWIGARRLGAAYPTLRDRPAVEPFPQADVEFDSETGEIVTKDAESPSEAVRRAFPEVDWHELFADETEQEWIVEPLLPVRRLVAIYSAPKLGKSLLLLEIACAVASGRSVLGTDIKTPRHVLYIDFENDMKGDIRERLRAMAYGPADLERLHYLSFPTMAALDSERGGVELMAAVHEYGAEVVVVDTVSRAIAGEENENDTWLSFYRHTGLKLKQAGVSLVRLDHSGKDESKGQRGGSAKSGDVDAVWRLSRVKDETYRLDCEAARMPVAEKVLVLHREASPLRHRVDAAGRVAAWQIQVDAAQKALEELGVPVEMGRDKAREVLRAAGQTAGNDALAEALRRRKNLSVEAADRWSE